MKFTIFQESRIGKRKGNQDRTAYCYSRDALFMVVADGMGGYLHGEVAAQIAVQFITEAFQREATPIIIDPVFFLSRAITNAHNAIVDYAFDKHLPDAPRTTLVACIVQGGHAYWAHAGDSRLYVIRRNRLLTRTRDHSRIQLMLENGLIDAKGAATHPARNRIYSCLGGNHPPQVKYAKPLPLLHGDILLLCSDGLWSPLEDQDVVSGFDGYNVAEGVPRLLDEAELRAATSCDNLSAVAISWEDGEQGSSSATQTLELDSFTTQLDSLEQTLGVNNAFDLTDDEIEKAIAEINAAIQKVSK